ncbi:unnamed protein product [Bemisia tabaci]|uniref:NWD1/2-like winged helix-turn-helix domain-containing protein n=1 Tax=Bemisia tabaci TaxID=7038 RepID=A0A9P0F5L9_BEMTA|nr:unnamed protein product [Bemisia tabaci]
MHYGTGEDPLNDPFQFEEHMLEIEKCKTVSRGCFFLSLVGNEWKDCPPPVTLHESHFIQIRNTAQNLNLCTDALDHHYDFSSELKQYKLNSSIESHQLREINRILRNAAIELEKIKSNINPQLTRSAVEHHFYEALGLDKEHMLSIIREFDGRPPDKPSYEKDRLDKFKTFISSAIPQENQMTIKVPWMNGNIDPDCSEHDTYLTEFQENVMLRLQHFINQSIELKPELNARNKAIQEVLKECLIHLSFCNKLVPFCEKLKNEAALATIREMLASPAPKHTPIIVQGNHGSGKTSLLMNVYLNCEAWFGKKAMKILRFAGTTPRSSYNLELLRIICEQMNLLLQPMGLCVPLDASFDPLYINNWFQTLVRRFEEEAPSSTLIILIDDLHRLNPLDSDIVAALSWLPIVLPKNVHLIATSLYAPDVLKMTPVQRERFKSAECLIELPCNESNLEREIELKLEELEKKYSRVAMARLCSFLTISEFGLTETELLELLMPTSGGSTTALKLEDGFYNFFTFYTVIRSMTKVSLTMEKFMSGRILFCWQHKLISKVARKRYLTSQDLQRALHGEIANLFFSEFNKQECTLQVKEETAAPDEGKPTPFQSALQYIDVAYSLRHVEESWIHLLKAGDTRRLKQLTFCNFDFLLASVRTISISYLRSIIEHARCYLLDRDLELIYYTIRKSSDVLTRDTLQLGAQIICWLRPVSDSSKLMSQMITSAMAWCDGYTDPLLVPLTGWLQPPLPLQIKHVTCNAKVLLIEPTPTAQHIVVVPQNGDPQLWHVMSNSLVHTFRGHTGPVLCISIVKSSQYLLTGSADLSTIVWDLKTFELKFKMVEHIAPVICVTSAMNSTVMASGGEDSRIIVSSLVTNEIVMKIDHHRGPVTALQATNFLGDVLVSGSADGCVCLWALDKFSLLNTINIPSGVSKLSLSSDSVFLLVACEDNQLYLHTLATGTLIHALRGHRPKVLSMCIAGDNRRAVVGGIDGRVYVYDMHTGCLARTITTPHNMEVVQVKITNRDDYLITAGGNRLTYWSFRREDGVGLEEYFVLGKHSSQVKKPHTGPITCLEVSRDGLTAVTGATDNMVNMWQLNSHELHSTMEGHTATITSVAISPNGLFAISGSEDKTARAWGLTLGLVVSVFTGHQSIVTAVGVLSDSRRVVSGDKQGVIAVWIADNGNLLHTILGPTQYMAITNNMKYAVSGDGGNSLRIWPLVSHRDDEKFNVSHTEEITCFVLTMDSLHLITGSQDTSLKVWQVIGGKLAQVLVGHSDTVTCVAVAITNKSLVVSGSRDNNLIVWDMDTGADLHLLLGHLGCITCVQVAGDGSIAVSGSEDKRIIVWDTKKGTILSTLQLHLPLIGLVMAPDASRIAVYLLESCYLPIICLHNTPATYVKAPVYVTPAKEVEEIRTTAPKRPMRRLLKKEVTLDTYSWQKKYAHLTSSLMMAAADERLRRRFSVSASMEEISKIPESIASQACYGPEQAALAQSQHFDQLEALWNRSPPRQRKHQQGLSKQNSRSSRQHSADDDGGPSPVEEVVDYPGD